ncbi:MAG TPA: CHAT domain-containing protein [Actinocrinis sp.]|uniref:CHAT domain-containing protein n=1 Tax=Actinocrinis sp. TaxID=1920516 RepID=UPI002DDCA776|nr:CHAT domain-containing protein [Actinocrinis sp.]HEV2347311.1 CHAT domain-containing protein [Actinocrinis sp.]
MKQTDLSATQRQRALRQIFLVRVPFVFLAGAAALFLVARLGVKLAGGLHVAVIEMGIGFALLTSVSAYGFRGPFRPPRQTAWPPALVICAMVLHPCYALFTPSSLALRLPSTAALEFGLFVVTRRALTRRFRMTLTEYTREPANESAAAFMLQECAGMAADPRLSPDQRKIARLNQARALVDCARTSAPELLLEAVEILEELAADPPPERIRMFQVFVSLAQTIGTRADEHGDDTGYLHAFDQLASAAAKLPADEGADAYVHAFAAQLEFVYARQATEPQDAVAHYRAAAEATRRAIDAVTREVHRLLPELYAYLAMYTAHIDDERDQLAVYDEAIALCRQGIRAAGRRPQRRAVADLMLSNLLQQRGWVLVSRLTEDPPEAAWDPIVADLLEARRLSRRVRRTGSPTLRREAVEQVASVQSDMDQLSTAYPKGTVAAQWRRSAALTEHGSTASMVRVRTQWVEWAETTDDPRWCAEAYESLLAVIPRAAASHYLSEERDRLLADVQNRAEEAGYWLSRSGRIREAVIALERGRAVAVSEQSGRDDSALEQALRSGPHHELTVRLHEARKQLDRAERQAPERPGAQQRRYTTPIQRAWSDFDTVRREISQVLGIELATSVTYGDIADAAADGPLVYLACASRSGYALIVHADAEPDWVPLPRFSRERVEKHAFGPYQALANPRDAGQRDDNGAQLHGVLRWLWENGVAPLVDQLPDDAVVTLLPMGMLGLLPIHAAGGPVRDGNTPAEWEHLIDHVAVRYAANARTQARLPKRAAAAEAVPLALLAFDAPNGDPDQLLPLQSTAAELDSVCRHWPRRLRTRLDNAQRDQVVAALDRHTVWHFAGHCEVNPQQIRSSALLLEGARLTLDDLSAVPYRPRRLAVLSACRSHRSGEQLPDEVVGMPTVLLLAGFAGVLATHWDLGDGSGAFIAARFYQAWQEERCTPTEALRAAQQWVRRATRDELESYMPGLLPRTHSRVPASATAQVVRKAAERPYAQPRSWAPFALTGV